MLRDALDGRGEIGYNIKCNSWLSATDGKASAGGINRVKQKAYAHLSAVRLGIRLSAGYLCAFFDFLNDAGFRPPLCLHYNSGGEWNLV